MNRSVDTYSMSGYRLCTGVIGVAHFENEQCPPFVMVMFVFAAAMLGGVWFSSELNSVAAGLIAWVAILATLGAFVDRRFSGAKALERRIRRRQKARLHALCGGPASGVFRQPRPDGSASTTREWTSTSAYRRHPRPTKAARAG